MVSIDKYWLLSTLEEVVPIPEAAHDGQEFSVVDGVSGNCRGAMVLAFLCHRVM